MLRKVKPRPFRRIGLRLEAIRLATGYRTKTKFAETIGLSPQGYNSYASGSERIGVDAAIRVSNRFGASLDYIYRGLHVGLVGDLFVKIRDTGLDEEMPDSETLAHSDDDTDEGLPGAA